VAPRAHNTARPRPGQPKNAIRWQTRIHDRGGRFLALAMIFKASDEMAAVLSQARAAPQSLATPREPAAVPARAVAVTAGPRIPRTGLALSRRRRGARRMAQAEALGHDSEHIGARAQRAAGARSAEAKTNAPPGSSAISSPWIRPQNALSARLSRWSSPPSGPASRRLTRGVYRRAWAQAAGRGPRSRATSLIQVGILGVRAPFAAPAELRRGVVARLELHVELHGRLAGPQDLTYGGSSEDETRPPAWPLDEFTAGASWSSASPRWMEPLRASRMMSFLNRPTGARPHSLPAARGWTLSGANGDRKYELVSRGEFQSPAVFYELRTDSTASRVALCRLGQKRIAQRNENLARTSRIGATSSHPARSVLSSRRTLRRPATNSIRAFEEHVVRNRDAGPQVPARLLCTARQDRSLLCWPRMPADRVCPGGRFLFCASPEMHDGARARGEHDRA